MVCAMDYNGASEVNEENKVGKGADETNLCKIDYANITENNVLYPYTC